MAAQTITGTVESIELEFAQEASYTDGSSQDFPIRVKTTLSLSDGRTAYVTTEVAKRTFYKNLGPCGGEAIHLNATTEKAPYPWIVKNDEIALPEPGTLGHKNGIAYSYDSATLMVWRGDVLTLRGTAEERTSRNGRAYLNVKRARIEAWERPEWKAAVDSKGRNLLCGSAAA